MLSPLDIAAGPPSPARWSALLRWLERVPAPESLLDALDERLAAWPDDLRVIPARAPGGSGESNPSPWARLGRQLVLEWAPSAAEVVDLLRAAPLVTGLTIVDAGDGGLGPQGVRELAAADAMARLRRLRLVGVSLGDDGLAALAASAQLAQLSRLELVRGDVGAGGLRALAESSALGALRELSLAGNGGAGDALVDLLRAPAGRQLRALDLSGVRFGRGQVSDLVAAAPPLVALDLSHTTLDAHAIRAIAERLGASLEQLALNRTELSDDLAIELVASNPALRLQTLALSGNRLTGIAVGALLASQVAPALRAADLSFNSLAPGALPASALARRAAALERIDLRGNRLSSDDLEGFVDAPHPSLRAVSLSGPAFPSLSWLEAGAFPKLRELHLSEAALTDASVGWLTGTSAFPGLEVVELPANSIGDDGAEALARAGAWLTLDLTRNPLGERGVTALAATMRARPCVARVSDRVSHDDALSAVGRART